MTALLRLITAAGLILLAVYELEAQSEFNPTWLDTIGLPSGRSNIVTLGFDKNLATYQWNAALRYEVSLHSLSFSIDDRYRSSVIVSPRKLIRDEHALDFGMRYTMAPRIAGVVRGDHFVLSDDQKFTDGQRQSVSTASSNAVYGGVESEIVPRVFVEPLLGMRFDNQIGVRDQGLSYALNVWTPGVSVGGYRSSFTGRFQRDLLEPRTLERRWLRLNIEKDFFEGIRDTVSVEYRSNRRDFYFSSDDSTRSVFNVTHNIERRVEDGILVANFLEYTVDNRLAVSLFGNFSSRLIERDFRYRLFLGPQRTLINTNVEEFRIGGIAQLSYTVPSRFSSLLQFHFNERDERHSLDHDPRIPEAVEQSRRDNESKKNNFARRTMLVALVDASVTPSDTVRFSGSASLLRYDTPHIENVDDRDELWYSLSMTTLHRMSQYLHLQVSAGVNLIHLVYLSAERSANNAWNRVLRVAPRLRYDPSRDVTSTNTFEVLANYTVYDYERTPLVQVTSFSFRQFAFIDSTRIRLTSRLALEGFAHIRLYQRGELRWDAFKELPLNDFEDKTFIGKVEYRVNDGLLLSFGVRSFSQLRYTYVNGTRNFEHRLNSVGPVAGLVWRSGDQSQVVIDGWQERQTQTAGAPRKFTNMTMTVNVLL